MHDLIPSNVMYRNAAENTNRLEEERTLWEIAFNCVEYLRDLTEKICKWLIDGIKAGWPAESRATFVLWICSIIVDPFALYVPQIRHYRDGEILLDFDVSLLVIISIFYVVISCSKILIYLTKYKIRKIFRQPKLWCIFVLGAPFVPIMVNVSKFPF